ncbi:Cellulose binding domain-containing protein [Lentzea fradiae]|uniref:Cellulose binding domain-containing protein n=1 Tax=Lentzea fradiae TaxID=200378 RepID=A0A1G7VN46_9PSEU|nr:cellulose binding domain-containing protein [Lentzea fradiae]SDG61154.1 Cellulose binding domain-containing protein [Lentzea fradiae]
MLGKHVLVVAVVLLVSACTSEPERPPSSSTVPVKPPTLVNEVVPPQDVLTVVRDVVDGRTVELADGTKVRIARLEEPKACFATAARDFARSTLLARSVRYTGLQVGEVELRLEDGTDYAVLAVRQGALRPENTDNGPLTSARDEASAAKRGLWGPPCDGSDTAKPTPTTTTTTTEAAAPAPATTAPRPTATTATPPPAAKAACVVSYRVSGQWQGGFQANVTVRNTGSAPVDGWVVRWTFSNGESVREMWDARGGQSGTSVSASNADYNPRIAPGASVRFGFNGTTRGSHRAPAGFSLNGTQCSVG